MTEDVVVTAARQTTSIHPVQGEGMRIGWSRDAGRLLADDGG